MGFLKVQANPMNEETKKKLKKEHVEKYRALNKKYGVAWSDDTLLPDGWTKEKMKAKVLESPDNDNLNFISIKWWDGLAEAFRTFQRANVSLSEAVCMEKQACLDWLFTPVCSICGEVIGVLTPPYLREKGLCSWRCWKDLYGEEYD